MKLREKETSMLLANNKAQTSVNLKQLPLPFVGRAWQKAG